MASKSKHRKRSKYKSHEYKPFDMFIRKANEKQLIREMRGYKINGN